MTVRIEKSGPVWTVIHSRAEARNAMDGDSAEALYRSFLEFENDDDASVAVFGVKEAHFVPVGISNRPHPWRSQTLCRIWQSPLMAATTEMGVTFRWAPWGQAALSSTSQ